MATSSLLDGAGFLLVGDEDWDGIWPLYLTHYPLFVLIGAAWVRTHGSLPGGAELSVFGVCAALALGTASYFLVERHFTDRRPRKAPEHAAAAATPQAAAAPRP